MNAATKTHPITGEALRPIFVSKTGREYWPIMGASEAPTETPPPPPAPAATVTIPAQPVEPPPARTFTADEIAKARQEEKDKLYPELKELRDKTAEFDRFKTEFEKEAQQKADEAAAKARAEAEEEARKKFEESDAKTLIQEVEQTWQQRWDAAEREREQERTIFAKEQAFQALKGYATEKVNAALQAQEVAPELADYVTGNTTEEIDASLEFAKQKTQQIVEGIRQAQVQARAQMPGVAPTGFAPVGPMDNTPGQETLTLEDLRDMSISEYAKRRNALLGQTAQPQNRGLYG